MLLYYKKLYVNLRLFPDSYEHLRGNHEIRKLILRPLFTLNSQRRLIEKFVGSVLHLMSTFANLEKVIIANQCLHLWDQHPQLIGNLSENFQFPSVRELHFATTAETWNKIWSLDAESHNEERDFRYQGPFDPLLDKFTRMFPHLDTLVIPNPS